MIKIAKLLPGFSKKYKKDSRVVNAILRSPFLFTDSIMADDNDTRAIRLPYFGVFNLKPRFRKEKIMMENSNIKEVKVEDLRIGQKVLILDTGNYKFEYSCSHYPCEGIVSALTDYPTIDVKAEGKTFELYEPQVGIYKL